MKLNAIKRSASLLLTALMILTLCPYSGTVLAEGADEIVYTDSFGKDSSDAYISTGAGVSIADGNLAVTGDGVVGLDGQLWYNGTYEVTIDMSGKSEWAGIQFCKPTPTAQRDEAGYMLYVRANGSIELYTGKNGVIGSDKVDLGDDKAVSLKVVTADGVITVYADGSELFEVKNSDFTYGYFSFVNYMEGTVVYDDLKITCPASDGEVEEIFLEMPDHMVALGKGETAKLDLNVLPLGASADSFEWKITDVYGNPSTLATVSGDGYVTAGNSTGTVRIEVASTTDASVSDYIEFAIVNEAQREHETVVSIPTETYSNDFSSADSNFAAYRAKMNISDGKLNLLAQGITMTNLNGLVWGDGTYEFDMDLGDVTEWAGIMICKTNPADIWDDSGYMLLVKPDGTFQLGVCGGFTPIAEGKIDGFKKGSNSYKLVKDGERILLYVNGASKPVADVKNSKFSEGYVSFVASTGWDAEKVAAYDNLKITPAGTSEAPKLELEELYLVGEYGCTTVKTGSTLNINAIASPYVDVTGMLAYTVENHDGAEASVDANGVLTAGTKTGKVTVTATADGVSASVTVEIVEKIPVIALNVTANKNARVMAVGKEIAIYANVFPANAESGAVEWSVCNTDGSETDLASISSDGKLKAEKCGTVRIRASLASDPAVYSEWIMTISQATNNGNSVVPSMKYSFFAHYVADLTTDVNGAVVTDPNELANAFDVEAYADKMAAMGCEYIVFTAWHYRMVCLFDSEAMLKWDMANHRTDRDLLGEMIDAVNARGINVVLYTHAFDGYDFKTAEEGIKVGWGSALKPELSPYYDKDFDYDKWNNFVNDVYTEVMERYGDRICGIWVDEGNMFEGMSRAVDFDRLIKTITSYNENIATFQNDHGFLYGFEYRIEEYWKHNEFADYSGNLMRTFKKKVPNPIISNNWWTSVSVNSANAVPYEGKVLFRYQVLQSGASSGGGIQWAAGPYPGEGCLYEPGVCETMEVMNAYLNPIAWTVKGTLPSTSYATKDNRNISTIGWGVAMQSVDGTREYIHVLNSDDSAIDGKTLKLRVPADGKIFTDAYLAINNKKVDLVQDETGVYLTLPEDEEWSGIDTVIELKVKVDKPVTDPTPEDTTDLAPEDPADSDSATTDPAPTEPDDNEKSGPSVWLVIVAVIALAAAAAVCITVIIKKKK